MSVVGVFLAGLVAIASGLIGGLIWGRDPSGLETLLHISVTLFAVSAVIPHYMWRGEPLLPDRRKRR